jgi:hypothetical protein
MDMAWRSLKRQRKHFNDPPHKSKRLRVNIFAKYAITDVTLLFGFTFLLVFSTNNLLLIELKA